MRNLFVLLTIVILSTRVFSQTDDWEHIGFLNETISELISTTDGYLVASVDNQGIIVGSKDGGATWDTIYSLSNSKSLVSNSTGTIFSTYGGSSIIKTSDFGLTWQSADSGISSGSLLQYLAISNDTLFAWSSVSPGQLFRSSDDGNYWTEILHIIPAGVVVRDLAVAPNGDIYLGTNSDGIHKSGDDGFSWSVSKSPEAFTVIGANYNGDIYAGGADSIYRSIDNGLSWVGVQNSAIWSITFTPNGSVFVGLTAGALASYDNGTTWDLYSSGMTHPTYGTPYYIGSVAVAKGYLFAGSLSQYSGIFKGTSHILTEIPEWYEGDIAVYPNPTSGYLNIDLGNSVEARVELYGVTGVLVLKCKVGKGNSIDLSSLPKGLYFLRVETNSIARVSKIVKD